MTATVKLRVAGDVGVPERVALRVSDDGVSVSPVGRPSEDHVKGADPALVWMVAEYGTATVPSGRGDWVVIVTWPKDSELTSSTSAKRGKCFM